MPNDTNKILKLWQELKRRKVVKVIILYSTTAFILLQLVNIIVEPLMLPSWVLTLLIILLVVGFPIAVIFSWIFDVTPEGIEVSVAAHKKGKKEQKAKKAVSRKSLTINIIIGVLLLIVVVLAVPKVFSGGNSRKIDQELEKSIAVIPFIDDSQEEGHTYIINGLMESILNNLAKIEDLKVISRTSVEKYRNNPKLITEIAQDLNVNYIVEGSGQKNGDKILLTVQLIEAATDKHLWSEQYIKNVDDIINLQVEVAKTISREIQAVITPDEQERIVRKPTSDPVAYDYYLQAKALFNTPHANRTTEREQLREVINLYEKATDQDPEFALAYAETSRAYLRLAGGNERDSLLKLANQNSDLALLYDARLDLSFISKGLIYYKNDQVDLAIPFFEKALEFNPSSEIALINLSWVFSFERPNTEKLLLYALRAIQLDIKGRSDKQISSKYSVLSRAFRFTGFFEEAEKYLDISEEYSPERRSIIEERAELLIDRYGKYEEAQEILLEGLKADNGDVLIYRFLCQNSYMLRNYKDAYSYYNKMNDLGGNRQWLPYDVGRYAHLHAKLGMDEVARELFDTALEEFGAIESLHSPRLLSAVYAAMGDTELALKHMKDFSREEDFSFWNIRFLKDDPSYDIIRETEEFKENLSKIEKKFWDEHDRLKSMLEDNGLL